MRFYIFRVEEKNHAATKQKCRVQYYCTEQLFYVPRHEPMSQGHPVSMRSLAKASPEAEQGAAPGATQSLGWGEARTPTLHTIGERKTTTSLAQH